MSSQQKIILTDSNIEIPEQLGNDRAGEFPFTRGIYPTMYRSRLWTMRQYAGFGTAEESNQRYRYLLSQGVTGLSVAFDLPTQIGYDSDNAMSEGEVGKVGVAINSLADMETLFDGIALEKVSTSMTINATASILLALYVAVAKKQNANLKKLSGTIQNDILKEYAARGTYIYPPKQSMRLITDIFQWCSAELPSWNTISISGYHMREAGSTAVQEVAFTLANGIAYVQAAIDAGLDVDDFSSRVSFFFNIHNNLFEEVAKLRCARKMWATIMKERFHAKNENSLKLRFHSQTAGSTLTAQQPEINISRVTLQALSAVLGGTQSLHCNGFDEALALPTENAARIALRTQQIIANESGVTETVDPLAGSYYVEYLTSEIEKRAWEYIATIDKLGGAVKAIEQNYIQNEIATSAYEYQKAIERKEKIIVGVNDFQIEEKEFTDTLKIDESIRAKQIARLNDVKKKRNGDEVRRRLGELKSASTTSENLMPHILNCVENYCTLGEIADTLRSVWGEYKEV
ncbi:MAG: methylmalonyl-CoA mutase [Ignavibacteriales bacterium]|nr:methylmalonyl-CoA mutase [Ignavibacteriales bacterium]